MKDQLEKSQSACKRSKQNLEAAEDEASNLKTQRRRLQRDLEETTEQKEAIERELQMLRAKLNRGVRGTRMGSAGVSRPSTRTGGEGTPEDPQSAADVDTSNAGDGASNTNNSSNKNSTNSP
ncbi:unnamed protein product [Mesocestoides corti]|uniref:Myosin tail domain-containing protein n=1 Tax=Mesocestoides corti TaxID=53468 RepID=A0A3P6HP87_MESCO|nr:unnamed protein product [Mesocestoides corti]